MKTYENPGRCFRFEYPAAWTLNDKDGQVSLWLSQDGGAVTISSARHGDAQQRSSAIDHCRRFVTRPGNLLTTIAGDERTASGSFTDAGGTKWDVRVLVQGRFGVLATYNHLSEPSAEEHQEASQILDSIAIVNT